MREDRASGELTAARRAVRDAEQAVETRREELEKFEETKEERRDRIYDAIMGRPVARESIDQAQEGVARIDQEGVLRLDNLRQAEGELEKRRKAAEVARAAFIEATKNRMKIDEHRAAWLEEENRENERRSEGELEDFTGRKQDLDS